MHGTVRSHLIFNRLHSAQFFAFECLPLEGRSISGESYWMLLVSRCKSVASRFEESKDVYDGNNWGTVGYIAKVKYLSAGLTRRLRTSDRCAV
jgi:hypothetical protein